MTTRMDWRDAAILVTRGESRIDRRSLAGGRSIQMVVTATNPS
jgi:hypothetical protein